LSRAEQGSRNGPGSARVASQTSMPRAPSDGDEDEVAQASVLVNVPQSGTQADESFSIELRNGTQTTPGDPSNSSQTEWEVKVRPVNPVNCLAPPKFDWEHY
jgi:hypothetical protein